ncbi:MAG TPA: hypothetical protein VFM25_04710, partial [Verrucomicrobiae bacterium]|nr:hypothetical protein [Verrucomicrobiae bacterium]
NNEDWMMASGTSNWSTVINPQIGTNTLRVCAMDVSGNRSATNIVRFVRFPPPLLNLTIRGDNGSLVISAVGGLAGLTYNVLGSTNLQMPQNTWSVIATGIIGSQGSFEFTNHLSADAPQMFFRLQVQ